MFCFKRKMNEIVNRFLLVGDKFMPGTHLKQPGFTYSACGPFTRNKERIETFMATVRTLKRNIFKHMTAVSENVYFDVLDDFVDKYNNTVNRSVRMKPIDVTSDSYAEYNEDSNEKYPKFKVGDHVRISKYKNIFAKGYTQNWSEKVFFVTKIENTVVISDLNFEEIA